MYNKRIYILLSKLRFLPWVYIDSVILIYLVCLEVYIYN